MRDEQWGSWRAAATGSALAGLVWIAAAAWVALPLVPDYPVWDQWHLIPMWRAHIEGEPVWPLLAEPYNGHLNVLTRAVMLALGAATQWDVRTEVVAGLIVTGATWIVLTRYVAAGDRRRLVLAAPIAALLFHPAQFEVFLSGYHLGQHLSQAAIAATLVCLSVRRRPRLATAGAVAAAAGATFTWGGGVIVWPVGGVVLLCQRRWRAVVVWAAVAAAMVAIATRAGAPVTIVWRALPGFVAALLGREFSLVPFPGLLSARWTGAILVVVVVAAAVLPWPRTPAFWRALVLCLTGAGAAVAIALGRAGLPDLALVSHYATATAPFAIGAVALLADRLLAWRATAPVGGPARAAATAAIVALAAVVPLQAVYVERRLTPTLTEWARLSQQAFGQLLLGTASDDLITRTLHPSPPLVRDGLNLLERSGLTAFAPCRAAGIVTGGISRVLWSETHVIEGWARDANGRAPVNGVTLEADGHLIASAALREPRLQLAWQSRRSTDVRAGWRIVVPVDQAQPPRDARLSVIAMSCNGTRAVIGAVRLTLP